MTSPNPSGGATHTNLIVARKQRADDETELTRTGEAMDDSATGVIYRRNIWQRGSDESLRSAERSRTFSAAIPPRWRLRRDRPGTPARNPICGCSPTPRSSSTWTAWSPTPPRRTPRRGKEPFDDVLPDLARSSAPEFEVTRLFASLATFDASDDRFDIAGVMGPDEFHDGYPDSPGRGVRNNANTNAMVAGLADKTLDVLDLVAGSDRGR